MTYWECVRVSRRGSRWLLRASYLVLLLCLAGIRVHDLVLPVGGTTADAIRNGLADFYGAFCICQVLVGLFLAPIFAAGSLMEERTGGTLLLIVASRMGPAEFIGGKLCGALMRVADLFACGIPFTLVCLAFGAVPLCVVLMELVLALAVACAASSLALLVAACCTRLVDSLVFTYLLQGLWYGLPLFNVLSVVLGRQPILPDTLLRLNVLRSAAELIPPPLVWDWHAWALPCMLAFAFAVLMCAMVVSAIWPLSRRTKFREPGPRVWLRFLRRISGRATPPVSDRPMLWRELSCRRATMIDWMAWSVFMVTGLIVVGFVISEWQTSLLAMQRNGPAGPPPRVCIIAGGATFCYLAFLALPFLALSGATGFADERDGHMLELLSLTDLCHGELLHAKIARLALLIAVLLGPPILLTGTMVLIGYSRWWSVLLVTMSCLSSFAFAAMLGLTIGLRSRNTNQAVATTISVGLIGGFLIPLFVVLSVKKAPDLLQYAGATISPPLQCFFLMMFDSVRPDLSPAVTISRPMMRMMASIWSLAYVVSSVGLYLVSLRCPLRMKGTT